MAEKPYNINCYYKNMMNLYREVAGREHAGHNSRDQEYEINYELEDVRQLIAKLNILYNELFNEQFMKEEQCLRKNYKIDYSLIDVQELIKLFNDRVYYNASKIQKGKKAMRLFKKMIYLYKHGRGRFKETMKRKFC